MNKIVNTSKMSVFISRCQHSAADVKKLTGADIVINGGYFNGDNTPCGVLIVDGKRIGYEWNCEGIGFDDTGICIEWSNVSAHKNFIWANILVQGGKPIQKISYHPSVAYSCPRTAIGKFSDGRLWILADAVSRTPEQLRDLAASVGVEWAVMLDGGASTQWATTNEIKLSYSGRKVHNYICIWTDKKEEFPVEKKYIVCVDPGHGGVENYNGAGDYLEHIFTLQLGLKLKAELERCGIRVVMTRETDKTVQLMDRSTFANNEKADLFISLHSNASSTLSTSGLCVYTAKKASVVSNALADKIIAQLSEDGVKMFGLKHYQQDFSVVYYTNMPAVLVEYGFHTNDEDRKLLANDTYQTKLAVGTAKAICAQLGVEYKNDFKQVNESTVKPETRKFRIEVDIASQSVADMMAKELIEKGYNPIILQYTM